MSPLREWLFPLSGRRRYGLLASLVGALLLFTQTLVLEHQLDLEHHQSDETCELCLHLAPLDHGLVNALVLPQSPLASLPPASQTLPTALPRPHTAYLSRAPPHLS
jgi:hypothetical protein